jgi:cell shape-determining protein MreC
VWKFILIPVGVGLVVITFFFSGRILPAPLGALSASFRELARAPAEFIAFIASREESLEDVQKLLLENQVLRAQLLAMSKRAYPVNESGEVRIVAKIYSSYPFNNRGLFSVNAGARDGVLLGAPVIARDAFFLGQIVEVSKRWSVARSIFDSGWELPVKVGADSVDALLVGGRTPHLTLIAREAAVEQGAQVFSSEKSAPYGLVIGEIALVRSEPARAFQDAALRVPYEVGDLTEIVILQ